MTHLKAAKKFFDCIRGTPSFAAQAHQQSVNICTKLRLLHCDLTEKANIIAFLKAMDWPEECMELFVKALMATVPEFEVCASLKYQDFTHIHAYYTKQSINI